MQKAVLMTYHLIYDKKAEKKLYNLEKDMIVRIIEKLDKAISNPFRYFERLEGRNDYKMRVGDIRILAYVDGNRIVITEIGHRKNVYE